jgi:hypothetical protein
MTLEEMLEISPYSLEKLQKEKILTDTLLKLTTKHDCGCEEYHKILQTMGYSPLKVNGVADIPFLPVRLFKEYKLVSVPKENVTRIMTSSGTTGQNVSHIALDAVTAKNQQKVLSKIIASYIGPKRLPLLILDSRTAVKDRKLFSARGAGIMGFSIYGHNVTYALDENMNLDVPAVKEFIEKYQDEPILLFGYTFMIWKHFYLEIEKQGIHFDFQNNGTLFHVGGWKKLKELAVDNDTYKKALKESCGISRVYNYYGMAEQLGSIFVECEYGHLHSSIFSDIIIRRYQDFQVADIGEEGLMEVVSVLPESYPGHALLTEDRGIILGEDDCPCGRKGKYFEILGRINNAEIRGCSDTYADKFK